MTAGTRKYREFLILRRFLITVVLGLVSHGGETLLAQQENSITAAPAASKVITEKFEHWRNHKFVKFSELGPGLINLEIQNEHESDQAGVPPLAAERLLQNVRYFLLSLRAGSYHEYRAAIHANHKDIPKLPPARVAQLRRWLISNNLLSNTTGVDDEEVLELTWATSQDMGRATDFYSAISPEASSYYFTTISRQQDIYLNIIKSLKSRPENAGIRASIEPLFDYGDTLRSEYERNGKVLVAIVRIHLQTMHGTAYPMLLRYAWIVGRGDWVPVDWAELWVSKSYFKPLF